MSRLGRYLALAAILTLTGCGFYHRKGLEPGLVSQLGRSLVPAASALTPELENQILALNPTNVTSEDVRDVLSKAPAPRVINIHGGIAKVIPRMESFAKFLVGMGYPAASLTNPSDGTYSFSCYESSEKIAGVIAWFYEREGLRPLLNGHSQGGMQVVKVLYQLSEEPPNALHVWNPLTWKREERCEIRDPLTGKMRPVAGLRLPWAASVGAGGLTRVLPNQWDMMVRLRAVPDSVEEFTGFCKRNDLLGGDFLGYGAVNEFHPAHKAVVRNVWLPTQYKHGMIPDTEHLLRSSEIRDWLNAYRPDPGPVVTPELDRSFDLDSRHVIWAAEVWYSIKKHWVLELQRLIEARRRGHNES